MKTISVKSHILLSKESYKYLYDLSKLTYAGLFLVGLIQKQQEYAIMGLVFLIMFFMLGKGIERSCLKH
ncbi:MAG: hypothetical protein UU93_C0027G0009 [Candidatus Amesbacteria bacterium GW2011_GWA2_42_12]|uniref:Uncharacterized protein n=1 Tax=Candidatus Amesbacteria bacterium GW2011_GWA2_42_12 TaxID=1618356 RepID=A0A0G1B036_9BACT|nr:MAG: hypothetical protein UU93_C0027G0009 [Candidatus Amesbacteria bacterium GW2011_GWA2_42_12]